MNRELINHCDPTPVRFEIDDPEVQSLAAEMRAQYYHRNDKHLIDIQLPEVGDEI